MAKTEIVLGEAGGGSGIKDVVTVGRYLYSTAGFNGLYSNSSGTMELIASASATYTKNTDYIGVTYNPNTTTITFTALKDGDFRYYGQNHFDVAITDTTVHKNANEVIGTFTANTSTYIFLFVTCIAL